MLHTSIILTTLLCSLLLGCHLYFDTLKPSVWGPTSKLLALHPTVQSNPVLSVLDEAAAAVANDSSRTLGAHSNDTEHNKQCCQISSMAGVLAAATGFQRTVQQTQAADDPQKAREMALAFRQQLAASWSAALEPVVRQNINVNSNSSCRCRSVQLLAAQPRISNQSTALLLVLNSWSRLEQQLQLYSPSLLMLWSYARLHDYGLHVYVHGADLPAWMPVYFIKVPGILHAMQDLSYQHVLYLDWDVLLSPRTAPPLSMFYNQYPDASLLMQAEYNFCAGVNLWRNTPQGRAFLQAWWQLGARGCCPTTQHDQSALKHIISAYLANFTRNPSMYGYWAQRQFKLPNALPPPLAAKGGGFAPLSTEAPPTTVNAWVTLRPLLQQYGSAIGLVGVDVHYPQPPGTPIPLALHNCMGLWWGCIPPDTPALIYHTGHGNMEKLEPSWMPQRVIANLMDWMTLSG